MRVSVSINFNKINQALSPSKFVDLRRFIANEIVTATGPFVPFREGYLKNSATIANDGSYIEYNMPYATRLYYNPQFNFNGAPQRGGLWVERSWAINEDIIMAAAQKYIERGL